MREIIPPLLHTVSCSFPLAPSRHLSLLKMTNTSSDIQLFIGSVLDNKYLLVQCWTTIIYWFSAGQQLKFEGLFFYWVSLGLLCTGT
jgi:hypothetical protein